MIEISFFRDGERIEKVRASGHSGYSDSGSDIICAAVSTLIQTAYLAIRDIGCDKGYNRDDGQALFEFSIGTDDEQKAHDAQVILRALSVGIEDLRSGYSQYIRTETVNRR